MTCNIIEWWNWEKLKTTDQVFLTLHEKRCQTLELIKGKSKVLEKNMSRERALNFDQS